MLDAKNYVLMYIDLKRFKTLTLFPFLLILPGLLSISSNFWFYFSADTNMEHY